MPWEIVEPDRGSVYVGIDPGKSGGLAVLEDGNCETFALGNSTDCQAWRFLSRRAFAVIEKNTGYVGGAGNPGSAMFQFGVSTGKLYGFLVAAGIPFEEATPGQWQKKLGIPSRKKNEGKTAFKRRLKQHAERLFPSAKITLATCDAILIAEYCRRKREGKL